MALDMALKFYRSVEKRVKTKGQNILRANSIFVEVITGIKLTTGTGYLFVLPSPYYE